MAVAAVALTLFATAAIPEPAAAAIVPTVPLLTAASFSVLAGTTVINTGPSTISQNVGVHPGSAVVGLDATHVTPPAVIEAASPVALQAASDLTAGYVDAAGRPTDFTLAGPELTGLVLIPGVYSGPSKSPLLLSGSLVLDGEGNSDAVFIFQTDSELTTMSGSSVSYVNGASACNVFWQVGSSAVLGSGSTFVGTVMALTSITVATGASIAGRVLARNAAVTLDDVTIAEPSCVPSTTPSPTTTTPATSAPATTTPATATPTTTPTADTTPGGTDGTGGTGGSTPASGTTPTGLGGGTGGGTGPGTGGSTLGTLPQTGGQSRGALVLAAVALLTGSIVVAASRRSNPTTPTS